MAAEQVQLREGARRHVQNTIQGRFGAKRKPT